MKILLLLSLFLSSLYSLEIVLDKPLENKIYTGEDSLVYIDKENKYTINNIETIKDQFTTVKKVNFGYTSSSVWSYFSILNRSNTTQTLILRNPYSNIRYIDVLVSKKETQEKHLLGCLREKSLKEMPSRSSIFTVTIPPNEKIDIYIKHKSISNIGIDWSIMNQQQFMNEDFNQTLIFGLFFGTVISLILYSLAIYKTFREISLIYYILFCFSNLILQFSINGVFYMLDIGLNPHHAIALSGSFGYFSPFILALFIISFFELKKHSTKLYYIVLFVYYISMIQILLNLPRFFYLDPWIDTALSNIILIINYFILLITALALYKKRLLGSAYFLAGISTFTLIYSIGVLFVMGIFNVKVEAVYYVLFAVLADMIFLSLAISQKVQLLKEEKDKAEKTLLEHTRFKNTGLMIAEVIHQLKTPITQISSIANHIAMIFDNNRDKLTNEEVKVANKLEENIIFMSHSINKLYDNYHGNNQISLINVDDSIAQVLELYQSKIDKLHINLLYQKNHFTINTDPYSLRHTLMIIIDNAIKIISERKIINPFIKIDTIKSDTTLQVIISDNAKGININNIDSIFDIYQSHRKSKGLGIGLTLAKALVKEQLKGEISVQNKDDGASFTITLNL